MRNEEKLSLLIKRAQNNDSEAILEIIKYNDSTAKTPFNLTI